MNTLNKKDQIKKSSVLTEDALLDMIQHKAQNLFETKQLLCSEAVAYTLCEAFDCEVDSSAVIQAASAFPEGMGTAGCSCGALSGAQLTLGFFLGRRKLGARDVHQVRKNALRMHQWFKEAFASTCCRVLTKKVKHDINLHFSQCSSITGKTARRTAELLLKARPELLQKADKEFLHRKDSPMRAGVRRIKGLFAFK